VQYEHNFFYRELTISYLCWFNASASEKKINFFFSFSAPIKSKKLQVKFFIFHKKIFNFLLTYIKNDRWAVQLYDPYHASF
tara:strand:+ start:826 stop:1068 length:243 start_codon:yes stop_codon:yes gene_type:complete